MARGKHKSPQTTTYGKRRKSQKKSLSLIKHNEEVLRHLYASI